MTFGSFMKYTDGLYPGRLTVSTGVKILGWLIIYHPLFICFWPFLSIFSKFISLNLLGQATCDHLLNYSHRFVAMGILYHQLI